ncbi:MAG: hypothetical protein OXE42_10945 [Gammaproteobacteria bacterium]|nr:hypothetical protein [Gammaproteobacteria bacterium]
MPACDNFGVPAKTTSVFEIDGVEDVTMHRRTRTRTKCNMRPGASPTARCSPAHAHAHEMQLGKGQPRFIHVNVRIW